jgi:hypothetical protein
MEDIATNFCDNLSAASGMCTVPYLFGESHVRARHRDIMYIAHCIELGVHDTKNDDNKNNNLDHLACMKAEQDTPSTVPVEKVMAWLEPYSKNYVFESVCQDLLREGLVLAWCAIEVLVSDVVRLLLNSRPKLIRRLRDNEDAKRLFKVAWSIELLEEYGFDVSSKLGDIFLDQFSLDSLHRIKAVCSALFPAESVLRTILGNRNLLLLNRRRNLIVHRRGIVDAEYQKLASDGLQIGDKIVSTAPEIEAAVILACECGIALLNAAEGVEST